jgi:hypothetical protein
VPSISVIGEADASRAIALRLAIINAARITVPRCTARLLPRRTTGTSVPHATDGWRHQVPPQEPAPWSSGVQLQVIVCSGERGVPDQFDEREAFL